MLSSKSLLNTSLTILSVLVISSCSSAIETPNQQIEIVALGAMNVRCDVIVGNSIYQAVPPQKITVLKTKNPMTVDCNAAGNRFASTTVEPKIANTTFANILNGGAGAIYDFGTGAMFKYPEQIRVDFTNVTPKPYMLPSYHNPDGIPEGYKPAIESTGPDSPQTLKSSKLTERMETMNEREIRKMQVEYGRKGQAPKSTATPNPYFPTATFPGTTSF